MYRNIDVMTEMRKLTDSKPVHAVAGAGVLASQALRDLPARLVQWTRENPPHALPARTHGYVQTAQARANDAVQTAQARANDAVQTAQARANDAVQTARTKATGRYDMLAARGKKAMNGHSHAAGTKSTPAPESKAALNGKPRGKAPSRSTTSRPTTSH
jgi:aminoglycoside phosphotransferase family enzyme